MYALRLKPGQDLKVELQKFQKDHHLPSAWIVTTVGSLRHLRVRLANRTEASQFDGPFEIVSLVGTLSADGAHLHISASDGEGRTIGGHLVDGNPVYTTAEIVIGSSPDLQFRRRPDPATGYPELEVESRTR